MTYIKQNKTEEYKQQIKDYSINMLKYELEETQINLNAELMFLEDRDTKLIKNLKEKIAIIKSIVYKT